MCLFEGAGTFFAFFFGVMSMSLYRITHIDEQRTRRRVRVLATNCRQAVRAVEQEFGDAWYMAAVRVQGGAV